MDFSPCSRTFSLSLLLSRKTEERLRFTKSLILSSKISHQTQGTRERLSQPPTFLPDIFQSESWGETVPGNAITTAPFFLRNQTPSPQPCQKNISYMFYIQVGMKNKKYFLAIFSCFITIFLGCVEVGIVRGREGEERGSARRLIRTGMFQFSRERGRTDEKKEDRFRKAVKKCEGTRVWERGDW